MRNRNLALFAFLSLPVLVLSSMAWAGPQLTKVRAHKSLHGNPRCPVLIGAATNALEQLQSTNGVARLAMIDRIFDVVAEASDKEVAEKAVAAIEYVKEETRKLPAMRSVRDFERQITESGNLGVCILPLNSSAGQQRGNHICFTEPGREAIMLTTAPRPDVSYLEWTLSHYSTMSMLAGERFVMEWLSASYELQKINSDTTDIYYQRYASKFSGKFPSKAGEVQEGFPILIMQLYQAWVARSLYGHFFPESLPSQDLSLSRADIAFLTRGRNASLTRKIAEELNLTEATYISEMLKILRTMEESIQRYRSMIN